MSTQNPRPPSGDILTAPVGDEAPTPDSPGNSSVGRYVLFWGEAWGSRSTPPTSETLPNGQVSVDPNWEMPAALRNPWELVSVAGITITGLWSVTARQARRVDQKKTPGANGATPTLLGIDPFEVDATVKMWTSAQLHQYQQLIERLQELIRTARAAKAGTPEASSTAVFVEHPSLALAGIRTLYVKDLTLPRASSTPGVFEATFRFTEFNELSKPLPITNKGSADFSSIPIVAPYTTKSLDAKSNPPSTSSAANP